MKNEQNTKYKVNKEQNTVNCEINNFFFFSLQPVSNIIDKMKIQAIYRNEF